MATNIGLGNVPSVEFYHMFGTLLYRISKPALWFFETARVKKDVIRSQCQLFLGGGGKFIYYFSLSFSWCHCKNKKVLPRTYKRFKEYKKEQFVYLNTLSCWFKSPYKETDKIYFRQTKNMQHTILTPELILVPLVCFTQEHKLQAMG